MKRKKIFGIAIGLVLLLQTTGYAWIGSRLSEVPDPTKYDNEGHVRITRDAYNNYCSDFDKWLGSADKRYFKNYLLVADSETQQEEFIKGLYEWETLLRTTTSAEGHLKFHHCLATVRKLYSENETKDSELSDHRLYNSIVLLKKAIDQKNDGQKRLALRRLAHGLHLLQDYFAHQNAPGSPAGHLYEKDANFTVAGVNLNKSIMDNIYYDNHGVGVYTANQVMHSSYPGEYYGKNSQVLKPASIWHKHSDPRQGWRYEAAVILSAKYIQAFYHGDLNYYKAILRDAQAGKTITVGAGEKYHVGSGARSAQRLDNLWQSIVKIKVDPNQPMQEIGEALTI